MIKKGVINAMKMRCVKLGMFVIMQKTKILKNWKRCLLDLYRKTLNKLNFKGE